jgi:hypothetical protein
LRPSFIDYIDHIDGKRSDFIQIFYSLFDVILVGLVVHFEGVFVLIRLLFMGFLSDDRSENDIIRSKLFDRFRLKIFLGSRL